LNPAANFCLSVPLEIAELRLAKQLVVEVDETWFVPRPVFGA